MIVADVYSCSEAMLAGSIHDSLEDRMAQEYPSDPLRKISALQTKVELAGNLSNKQNLAEN